MSTRTILVPTDFSAHSSAALDRALELAGSLSARVVLLHSYFVSPPAVTGEFWVLPPDFMSELRAATCAELEQLAKRGAEAGVRCEYRASPAPAVEAILDVAKLLPADLIVLGTHGRTGLKHAVLGSVAERVVRLAPCPVLTVKAHPTE
jgi:nucleotide-binding universal stress UspA family protein